MSLKEELKELYSSILDYDPKYLRTLLQAIKDPIVVTKAPSGNYTSALRFALATFSTAFILAYFFDPSWVNSRSVVDLLNVSLREQQYQRVYASLEENYSAFVNMIVWIPAYFLSLKLLFFRKGSWYFFYRLTLYQLSVLFLLYPMIMIWEAFMPNSNFWGLIETILVALAFLYQLYRLNFNGWYLNIPKGIIAILVAASLSFVFNSYLYNLGQNLLNPQQVYHPVSPSNELFKEEYLPDYRPYLLYDTADGDSLDFWYINSVFIGYIKDNTVIWAADWDTAGTYPIENISLLRASKAKELIAWTYTIDTRELALILTHESGSRMQHMRMDVPNSDVRVNILHESKDEIILLSSGQENRILTLSRNDESWNIDISPSQDFQSLYIHEIRPIPGSTDMLYSVIDRPLSHVSGMWIERRDRTQKVVWRRAVYDKKTPFTPNDLLSFKIDTSKGEILSYYTLARDSTMYLHLQKTALNSGNPMGSTEFEIHADVIEMANLSFDDNYIYLGGEAHKNYVDHFWNTTYHIGMIVAIERAPMKLKDYVFVGPDGLSAHSRVVQLEPRGDSLYFYSYDYYGDRFLFTDNIRFNKKSAAISDLFE